jgi:hypothetical protein
MAVGAIGGDGGLIAMGSTGAPRLRSTIWECIVAG